MTNKNLLLVSFLLSAVLAFGQNLSVTELDEYSLEKLLAMDIVLNSEVGIGSKNTDEKISDASGVVSVISQDDLQRFGGLTLKDALERVPSINSLTSNLVDRSTITVRGISNANSSTHILFLINGRPIREQSVNGGIDSDMVMAFPINMIERIEVIRGPGSVLYGTQAINGVVNVVTKSSDQTSAEVSLLGSADGAIGTSGYVLLQKSKLSMTIGGRYLDKGNQSFNLNKRDQEGEAYTISSPFEEIVQGAYLDVNYGKLNVMGSYTDFQSTYFLSGSEVNGELLDTRKYFTNVGYKSSIKDGWNTEFNLTGTFFDWKGDESIAFVKHGSDIVAEWTNSISLAANASLTAGGLYNLSIGKETDKIENEVLLDDHISSGGLYAQVDYWPVPEKLKLLGGLQGNIFKNEGLDIVPRIGTVYYLTTDLSVKALYGYGFRAQPLRNLYFQGFPASNPDLLSEKTSSYDVGLNYNVERVQLGLNYFYSAVTNLVVVQQLDDGTSQYVASPDEVMNSGLEVDVRYFPTNELYITGSLLYHENEQPNGDNTSINPTVSTKLGLSYSNELFTLSVFDIFGGEISSFYDERTLNEATDNYHRINAYAKLNLNQFIENSNLSFYVQADNILDETILQPMVGPQASSYESLPVVVGRTVYLGLQWSLNKK